MRSKDLVELIRNKNKPRLIGIGLVLFGLLLLSLIYMPILLKYLNYNFSRDKFDQEEERIVEIVENVNDVENLPSSIEELFPDSQYSILIPKIDAASKVVEGIDPYNQREYTKALNDGIAEADTSLSPGKGGNTFLFAHSALGFYDLVSNNVNFYLLNNLEQGDKVFIMYQEVFYEYSVSEKKIVSPGEIDHLSGNSDVEMLTLMTCWPAGTDYKRVIVQAERL